MPQKTTCFTYFKASIKSYSLPKKFTFPFYYEPNPLCVLAAKELQDYLEIQTEWNHNFGLDSTKKSIALGKMFGVLVVENQQGEIGYLTAFSGKLADKKQHPKFVPPVFDVFEKGNFFEVKSIVISKLNTTIEILEANKNYRILKNLLNTNILHSEKEIEAFRETMRIQKKNRREVRKQQKIVLSESEYIILCNDLIRESLSYKHEHNLLKKSWEARIEALQKKIKHYEKEIDILKKERKIKSAALQQEIFEKYQFLNKNGVSKSLSEIFKNKPVISGAGECAAPKLLQYAFKHQLKPIAMAEFWWGIPPKSHIRKHKQFYPACRGKCEPILGVMLEGITMDENPLLINPAEGKVLEIVFEDAYLLVVNKPTEFLSVPGKTIQDSVATRMKKRFPTATGPLIVHRLDMATSGLLLIAKTLEIHKSLQSQFIKRTVKKRYIALLDGILSEEKGVVSLPLRVDLNDRPRQLVCYEHGKMARTRWKVIERKNNKTKVAFYPITGRTHQLRMHAAHSEGLNMPIIGDDLYGTKSNRLHLHAEYLEFTHPITEKKMRICVDAEF